MEEVINLYKFSLINSSSAHPFLEPSNVRYTPFLYFGFCSFSPAGLPVYIKELRFTGLSGCEYNSSFNNSPLT